MWAALVLTLTSLVVATQAQYGRYRSFYPNYMNPWEQRYRPEAEYAPRHMSPVAYHEDSFYNRHPYEPYAQSQPQPQPHPQPQPQPHPPPEPQPQPPRHEPKPKRGPDPEHFTYEETSHGRNPLSQLNPYNRRVVEDSYKRAEPHGREEAHAHAHPDDAEPRAQRRRRPQRKRARTRVEEDTERVRTHAEEETERGSGEDDCAMMKVRTQGRIQGDLEDPFLER